MWTTRVTQSTSATKEDIWRLWADVAQWSRWDKEVETSTLAGDFAEGSSGILKPANGPKSHFKIIKCIPNRCFTNRTALPLCRLDFIHEMSDSDNGLQITHRVEIKGVLSFLFSRILGQNLAHGLPQAVANLIQLAESKR